MAEMIETQYIELLHDTSRDKEALFLVQGGAAMQRWQIKLIDAHCAITDYLPRVPLLIVPTRFQRNGMVFRDTYIIRPIDIELEIVSALIVNRDAVNLLFTDVDSLIRSGNVIQSVLDISKLQHLHNANGLQVVGVFDQIEPPKSTEEVEEEELVEN